MSIFSSVPTKPSPRSRYHFTPENKVGFDVGGIYPILTKTVYAGDLWSIALQNMVRSVPMLSPVMHRNDIKVDAFFVPFRLIWKSAPDWLACNDKGVLVHPPKCYATAQAFYQNVFEAGGIMDYLGFASIPYTELVGNSLTPSDRKVNALPLRAYRMIYDYYFRNKAVEDDVLVDISDFYDDNDLVFDSTSYPLCKIQNRPWRRDIFTACLPDPQNGNDVLLPSNEIEADGPLKIGKNPNGDQLTTGNLIAAGSKNIAVSDGQGGYEVAQYVDGLKQDPVTMRQVRFAEIMEEFEEAQARGGSNQGFKEWLKNIWGVTSSDARLDRPEYLGGYRGPIQISEIPQTSAATATSPQGTLAGKGLSVGGRRLFRRHFFEEPGVLMITMSIVPKSAYCQGDPREWLIDDCYDYPNPYFDHLGEQDVLTQELNALQGLKNPGKVFGYNVRNYFCKSYPDEIHGKLRTDLAYWHEGRLINWNNSPGLNPDFLKVTAADVARLWPSSETSNKLIGQFFFDIRLKRNFSYYGLPKFGA